MVEGQDDHKTLRDVLRRRVVRCRQMIGDELLEEYRFFQYYSDAEVFAADFKTHEARVEYIERIRNEEAELDDWKNHAQDTLLPLFCEPDPPPHGSAPER